MLVWFPYFWVVNFSPHFSHIYWFTSVKIYINKRQTQILHTGNRRYIFHSTEPSILSHDNAEISTMSCILRFHIFMFQHSCRITIPAETHSNQYSPIWSTLLYLDVPHSRMCHQLNVGFHTLPSHCHHQLLLNYCKHSCKEFGMSHYSYH
jgi:hypothetical protein